MTSFWLYENNQSETLRGHAEQCPFFMRQGGGDRPTGRWIGPFDTKLEAIIAAQRKNVPFRWCKSCQQIGDSIKLAEINAQLDRARNEYSAALHAFERDTTIDEDSPEHNGHNGNGHHAPEQLVAASDHLTEVLHSYLLFIRKSLPKSQHAA
jgi:hypothetical protein